MKIMRVEVYKNAIKVRVYLNAQQTFEEIIKIRWYQRKSTREMIDKFYLDNIVLLYSSGVEWQLEEATAMRYNFKTKQLE